MLQYDDKSIVSGYIKQLLNGFNLPSVKIYKDGDLIIAGEYYIRNNRIVKAKISSREPTDDDFDFVEDYHYGLKYRNITRTLQIKNNLYDSYTHKYLGRYLRFLRDYRKLDLMSLYNCYSNELATNLDISSDEASDLSKIANVYVNVGGLDVGVVTGDESPYEEVFTYQEKTIGSYAFNFDSSDSNYKIYMIPVTLFKDYTIAIDSDMPIEIICGFYGKNQIVKSVFDKFYQKTYLKVNKASFTKPFVYSLLKDIDDEDIINTKAVQNEDTLKLFIKVPFSNNSSLVVLEGNYVGRNDFVLNKFEIDGATNKNEGFIKFNYSITNYEDLDTQNEDHQFTEKNLAIVPLVSKLQLLRINSKINHPFADRLYEYLLDNAITNVETISDNIKRVQTSLHNRYEQLNETNVYESMPVQISDDSHITYNEYVFADNDYAYVDGVYNGKILKRTKKGLPEIKDYGMWDPDYNNILYDVAVQENVNNDCYDVLGYVDKDVEKVLGKDPDIYNLNEKDYISGTKYHSTK